MIRREMFIWIYHQFKGLNKGVRPVVIIQNDTGNKYSPTVIVAAITGRINKAKIPTHVEIEKKKYKLDKDSVILLEQIRTLDKNV